MQKLFFSLTLLIILIIASVYGLLFTSTGNGIVASYIEDNVNKNQKDVKLKVNKFVLTTDTIDFNASISDSSKINISGSFSILEKSVDITYDIDVKDLSKFQSLIKQKLNGPFSTTGFVKGDAKLILVEGKSGLALSDTKYDVSLINYELSTIKFDIKNAQISKLLYMLNQPVIARGNLNVNGNINNASINSLDGDIKATLTNGKMFNDAFNKAYKQNLTSNVYFKSNVNAVLKPNTIEAKSDLQSSLAEVYANETIIDLKNNQINSDYKIDIKNLSLFQSLVGRKLNGSLSTQGEVFVKDSDINIVGNSNLVDSETSYDLKIENAKAKSLKLKIVDAKLDKLLHMINEPVYTNGNLSIDANINNLDLKNLDGNVKSSISNAKIINPVVNTVFELDLKDSISYSVNTDTNLLKSQAITSANLVSSVGLLTIKKAVFNTSSMSLNSDYKLNINDLGKLYDLSKTKMRGAVEVNGDVLMDEDLKVTGRSKILNGDFSFNLKNENLTAKLKDIEVLQLTHMLYYPKLFDSQGSFEMAYNLESKKGHMFGRLIDGQFVKNEFSSLVNQFAKFDITKEIYDTTDINSTINDFVIKATVNMKSKRSTVDVTKSIIDLNTQKMDAQVRVNLAGLKTRFKVKGKITDPRISLDTSKKKEEIKDKLKNSYDKRKDKVEENLKEVLKDKVDKQKAKELLKDFKSLF